VTERGVPDADAPPAASPTASPTAPPVRVAIVDDEPAARERLRMLLAEAPGVSVVAECGDGADAVATLAALAPPAELLFLDVQMPELDGFGVLAALADLLGAERLPAVVFVTAYDEYALRAFDVSAVDYLLKPFDRARFARALARGVARARAAVAPREGARDGVREAVRAELRGELRGELREELRALLAHVRRPDAAYAERFAVRAAGRVYFVRAADVDWLDVEGNYVRLHVGGKVHVVRGPLGAVEARLDPAAFVRVHRSAIVRVDRIASLEPYFHGEYVVTLRDGSRLTSSRSYSAGLRALLG
jgi:two-component system, LytTR family, response regulator